MNNRDLVYSLSALVDISSRDLEPKIAWKLCKLLLDVERVLLPYEMARKKLIEKYTIPGEGGTFIVKNNLEEKFNSEIQEILSIELDFNFDKISLKDLGKEPIKSSTLAAISWLIMEE